MCFFVRPAEERSCICRAFFIKGRRGGQAQASGYHIWRVAWSLMLCGGESGDAAWRPEVAAVIQQPKLMSPFLPLTHTLNLIFPFSFCLTSSLYLLRPPWFPWWQLWAAEITLIREWDRRKELLSFVHVHPHTNTHRSLFSSHERFINSSLCRLWTRTEHAQTVHALWHVAATPACKHT